MSSEAYQPNVDQVRRSSSWPYCNISYVYCVIVTMSDVERIQFIYRTTCITRAHLAYRTTAFFVPYSNPESLPG